MVKDHLRQPVELVLKEYLDECPRGWHTHTFFELIYIHDGEGTQLINETEMNYKKGDLFLVAPNDNHLFKIRKSTQFFFIRFNDVFVRSPKERQRLQQLEMILSNAGHDPGCIIADGADRNYSIHLLEMIIAEHGQNDIYHHELIDQLINTLLIIVARNINHVFPHTINESSEKRVIDILTYIQTNIYSPDKLRISAMSEHFGIAGNYLGAYFKQHTNESPQQYIIKYKLKLIESRLLRTDMRVNEIANELGFTDKSHLNRIFKKYHGLSPGEFKRNAVR